MLSKARAISRLEFSAANHCHLAADVAFTRAFLRLSAHARLTITYALASALDDLLCGAARGHAIAANSGVNVIDTLIDLCQVLLNERTAGPFRERYQQLLARRLLSPLDRFSSAHLNAERTLLDSLPVMPYAGKLTLITALALVITLHTLHPHY